MSVVYFPNDEFDIFDVSNWEVDCIVTNPDLPQTGKY
jgi:hypothetical protein